MNTRLLIALLSGCFVAGTSVAAELPLAGPPQLYYPGPLLPVEWTGLYFGANAGYGSAEGSSSTRFAGDLAGGTTTPSGAGVTELSGGAVFGSSKPSGAIAGGQIGFNWQTGRFVFGAEADGQWSGQQADASIVCTPNCVGTSTTKIKSLATGRARVGVAFDWLLPYVTVGAALVTAEDKLTLTVAGVTGGFPQTLSATSLGWTAGAGVDVALSSTWSARFEYLHIEANGLKTDADIPGILGSGIALGSASYRDDILRFALNYRFGPRGGPGVLERPVSPDAFAINYDFLPNVVRVAEQAMPARPQQATPSAVLVAGKARPAKPEQATAASAPIRTVDAAPAAPAPAPIRTADAAPETTSIPIAPTPAKPAFKNFNEIGALEDEDTIALPKLASKKPRERAEDESQRLKRIMSICSGC